MDAKHESRRIGANESGTDGPKKDYVEPKLTVHGNVEDITKNIGQNNADGGQGSTL